MTPVVDRYAVFSTGMGRISAYYLGLYYKVMRLVI